jgi:phage tail-like protein
LLGRFVSLFEASFEDLENRIASLPVSFDAQAAPPELLPWLASWLGIELRAEQDEDSRRAAIASAFDMHGQRGTRAGLEAAIRAQTGLDAVVEEPIVQTDWWALPDAGEASVHTAPALGFTTVLASADPQGAVAGASATLDASHLISSDEYGAPLFSDVAHRFTVRVYRGAHFTPHTLDEVARVLDREKPVHTDYHICVVEPCMQVGLQARLGIDTVVAGGDPPARLPGLTQASAHSSKSARRSAHLRLGGQPAGRMGHSSRVGDTTRLGGAE